MNSEFPYEELKTTHMWEVLDMAIQDLADNSDNEENTVRLLGTYAQH